MAGHFIYILLYFILFSTDSLASATDSVAYVRDTVALNPVAVDSIVRDSAVPDSVATARDSVVAVRDTVAAALDTVVTVRDTVAVPVDSVVSVKKTLVREYIQKADSLRKAYEFRKAVSVCQEALSSMGPDDSLDLPEMENLLRQCENAVGMSGFIYEPQVVDSKMVAREDFILWYPFEDGRWHPLSCASDSLAAGPFPLKGMLPDSSAVVLSSALPQDRALCAALYQADSLMLPDSVKVLPVLSQDGKTLYFSSDGLYGMGGYDLYKSEFDESSGEWGRPVNLGFPFSSPFNDYLLLNTDDGRHTIFASDRDCPADSVKIYVIDFDPLPVRKPFEDIGKLRELMSLGKPLPQVTPSNDTASGDSVIPENADTRRYMQKMQEVKALRDAIYDCGKLLDQDRARFAMSDDEQERLVLTGDILKREATLPVLQDSLLRAREELQMIEMEFLFNGIVVDVEPAPEQSPDDRQDAEKGFPFEKKHFGEAIIFTERHEN